MWRCVVAVFCHLQVAASPSFDVHALGVVFFDIFTASPAHDLLIPRPEMFFGQSLAQVKSQLFALVHETVRRWAHQSAKKLIMQCCNDRVRARKALEIADGCVVTGHGLT